MTVIGEAAALSGMDVEDLLEQLTSSPAHMAVLLEAVEAAAGRVFSNLIPTFLNLGTHFSLGSFDMASCQRSSYASKTPDSVLAGRGVPSRA